jgi:hypothetical protein
MATEAIRFESQLEILDPVLALSPPYVPFVAFFWLTTITTTGYDEEGVGPLLHRLSLVGNSALASLASGLIHVFGRQPGLFALGLVAILASSSNLSVSASARGLLINPIV